MFSSELDYEVNDNDDYNPENPHDGYDDESCWSPTSPFRDYGGDSPVYEPETETKVETPEPTEHPHGVTSKYRFVPVNDTKSKLSILLANIQRHTGELLTAPKFLQSNKQAFPTSWDHNCWWCCHKFKTCPVGLPIRFEKSTNSYNMHGFFCSYNCACAYAISTGRAEKSRPLLFRILMKQYKDVKKSTVEPAPHYTALAAFGGPLTIDAFRQQHCRSTRIITQPMESVCVPFGYNVYKMKRNELEQQPAPALCNPDVPRNAPRRRTKRAAVKKSKATGPVAKRQKTRGVLPEVPETDSYRMRRSAGKPSNSGNAIQSMMKISFK